MSLLVRAAILGGLAYAVSRVVRKSQHSLESSRLEARRLARSTNDHADNDVDSQQQRDALSAPTV